MFDIVQEHLWYPPTAGARLSRSQHESRGRLDQEAVVAQL